MTATVTRFLKTSLFATYSRSFYKSAICTGTDKTTATILNKQIDSGLMINSVSSAGFELNNGMSVIGPMVIFPKTVISWNIAKSSDMNEAALSLFLVLEPKIDVLVIGLDDVYPYNAPFLQNVREILRSCNIKHEILQTKEASAAFNFLNCDSRYVVGALLPPRKLPLGIQRLEDLRKQRTELKEILSK